MLPPEWVRALSVVQWMWTFLFLGQQIWGGGGIMGEKWESGGIRCNFGVKLGGLGVGFGGGGIWRAVLFGAGV